MAEIEAQKTAEELYNQLSPMEKQQYDGVFGMAGFKARYEKDPTSQFVLGDVNYAKFKAIADAEAAAPKKGFFESLISSASAAEPDKVRSTSRTPGFETIVNPDGTISIVPVGTSSNLPFDVGGRLFDEFESTIPEPNQTSFDPTDFQSIFSPNVKTGITSSSAAQNVPTIPFGTSADNIQGFTDKEDFSTPQKSSGIKDLFRTLLGFTIPGFNALKNFEGQPYERFTPGATIKGGIYKIGDFNQPAYMVNDFYNPNTGLNRFQRAEERFKKTGSMKDLFAASRSGEEFFRRRRELKDAQTKAAIAKRKAERDVLQFTSGTATGPGRDTFEPGGFDTSAADRAGTSLGSGQFSPKTSKGRSGY